MNGKQLGILGLVLSAGGAIIGLASNIVSGKQQDIKIQEAVDKAIADRK